MSVLPTRLRHISTALLLATALPIASAQATTNSRDANVTTYDQCILRHVNPAVNNRAAELLQQACKRSFQKTARTKRGTGPEKWVDLTQRASAARGYNNCLFSHLKSVRNDRAAQLTQQYCASRFASEGVPTAARTPLTQQNLIRAFVEQHLLGKKARQTKNQPPSLWMNGDHFSDLAPAKAGLHIDAPFMKSSF
ncbi:MAG: hypothetical protein HQL53_09175 [Magnetococcales bacterium]|nr:hypothetical protein [Magnetococcales bacterium]